LKMNKEIKMTPHQAREKLWHLGEISYILEPAQQKIYNFMRKAEAKISVVTCSRRIGKSTSAILYAVEECIKKPGYIVKYLAPRKDEIQKAILPTFRFIFGMAPDGLKLDQDVKYYPSKGMFVFPNGSEIHISPAENNHYRSLRGGSCHLGIIDEAGFVSELEDALISVLLPTTNTTKGKILVISTPPEEADHYYATLMEQADLKNNLLVMTIDDYFREMDKYGAECARLPKEEIEMTKEEMGGETSLRYRREYLCELITSDESKVVPEFTPEVEQDIVKEHPRPDYFHTYTAMDIGVKDLTVVLFAYYDFLNNAVVIEDEFVINGPEMTTDKLATGVREKEESLWFDHTYQTKKDVYMRVSDNNLLLIQDLIRLHNLYFVPTEKHNKFKYINELRQKIASGQIIINPKCQTLIKHLRYGQWDRSRKDFKRTRDNGHADGIAALMYLIRNVSWGKNPFPANYEFRQLGDNLFISPHYVATKEQFQETIKNMFTPKSSLVRRKRGQ
jgi:hypothetical protein